MSRYRQLALASLFPFTTAVDAAGTGSRVATERHHLRWNGWNQRCRLYLCALPSTQSSQVRGFDNLMRARLTLRGEHGEGVVKRTGLNLRGSLKLVRTITSSSKMIRARATRTQSNGTERQTTRDMRVHSSNLRIMYYSDQGLPQSHHTAVKWFRKLADQGHGVAQFNFGAACASGCSV